MFFFINFGYLGVIERKRRMKEIRLKEREGRKRLDFFFENNIFMACLLGSEFIVLRSSLRSAAEMYGSCTTEKSIVSSA